jgi:hypothetical protein
MTHATQKSQLLRKPRSRGGFSDASDANSYSSAIEKKCFVQLKIFFSE